MSLTNSFLNTAGLQYYDTKLKNYIASNYDNVIENIALDNATTSVVINNKLATIGMANYALKTDIAAALKFKGSCTGAELAAKTDMVQGDVWSITTAGEGYKAGSEYAYNGTAWFELGPGIDLSSYATKAELEAVDDELSDEIDGIKAAYLKNATVANNTLTITKQDDTTITFQGGSGGANNAIRYTYHVTTIEEFQALFATVQAWTPAEAATHTGEIICVDAITGLCDHYFAAIIQPGEDNYAQINTEPFKYVRSIPYLNNNSGTDTSSALWFDKNDHGTTLPTLPQNLGTTFNGRLFYKEDEEAWYVVRSINNVSTWNKFIDLSTDTPAALPNGVFKFRNTMNQTINLAGVQTWLAEIALYTADERAYHQNDAYYVSDPDFTDSTVFTLAYNGTEFDPENPFDCTYILNDFNGPRRGIWSLNVEEPALGGFCGTTFPNPMGDDSIDEGRLFFRTDQNKLYIYKQRYLDNNHWYCIGTVNNPAASISASDTGYATGAQVYAEIAAVDAAVISNATIDALFA